MEEHLPIDIHYNKLLDWLINRRHCQAQWQAAAVAVREKINGAIQDMPAVEEITKLLQGTHINYFHCVRIVQILKCTDESNSKDIFGRYSSQKVKDWLEILKMYEKDCLYLAEAAQMLSRNVNYEIPALKKQIAKCTQAQDDCARKETEYARQSAELREKFHTSCKQMNIEGKRIKRELAELVRNMPTTYTEFACDTTTLAEPIRYYADFVAFLQGNAGHVTTGVGSVRQSCLPMLHHIMSRGNTTVYEWRTGVVPVRVEQCELDLFTALEEEEKNENGDTTDLIDWGNIDDAGITSVDLNIESVVEANAEDIDWSAVDDLAANCQIELISDENPSEISEKDDTIRGIDALTLLDNTSTRNLFLDELFELESFLQQRLEELGAETDGGSCGGGGSVLLTSTVFQSAPVSILVNRTTVQSMLNLVTSLLTRFTMRRMQDLCLIRSSPRYVDRLVENLTKISADADKMASMSRLMVIRREEALAEKTEAEPKLELVRTKTKELQKQIESDISLKYKNRRVNIMGEINTI